MGEEGTYLPWAGSFIVLEAVPRWYDVLGDTMDINEVIFSILVSVLAAIAGAAVSILKAYTEKIVAKIEDDQLRTKVSMLNEEAHAVVAEISQTLVDEVRKASEDGRITPEERENLRNTAIDLLKSRFSKQWLDDLRDKMGLDDAALQKFLIGKIEAHVWGQKMAMMAASGEKP